MTRAARLMLYLASWLADRHQSAGVETSMTKLLATETAMSVALKCQMLSGAYGYVKDFDTEGYARDALLLVSTGGSPAVRVIDDLAASMPLG